MKVQRTFLLLPLLAFAGCDSDNSAPTSERGVPEIPAPGEVRQEGQKPAAPAGDTRVETSSRRGEPLAVGEVRLSEFVVGYVGNQDMRQFVEIEGAPNHDYSEYSVLIVDGVATQNPGAVLTVIPVGTTDEQGIWVSDFFPATLPNDSQTIMLVKKFTGEVGLDLDTDADAGLDVEPWETLADAVGLKRAGAAEPSDDKTFADVTLFKDFDGYVGKNGQQYRVQGASRVDNTWRRNHYFGEGIDVANARQDPNFLEATRIEAVNTPGLLNRLGTAELPQAAVRAAAEAQVLTERPEAEPTLETADTDEAPSRKPADLPIDIIDGPAGEDPDVTAEGPPPEGN
jgi:hypothetical protein